MINNLKNREILEKIKENINEMNDSHLEIESEMSKGIFINDSILKKEELLLIKKENDSILEQLRTMIDVKINSEE